MGLRSANPDTIDTARSLLTPLQLFWDTTNIVWDLAEAGLADIIHESVIVSQRL